MLHVHCPYCCETRSEEEFAYGGEAHIQRPARPDDLGNVDDVAILARSLGQSIAETGTTIFRPAYTPVSLGAVAGRDLGPLFDPERYTPLHAWHAALALGPRHPIVLQMNITVQLNPLPVVFPFRQRHGRCGWGEAMASSWIECEAVQLGGVHA